MILSTIVKILMYNINIKIIFELNSKYVNDHFISNNKKENKQRMKRERKKNSIINH